MSKLSKFLPFALFLAFFLIGFATFINSKPSHKNERVYKIVRKYSPYYIEKTFGGLIIKKKGDDKFKKEPDNANFFKEFEALEKKWGEGHLKLEGNSLNILDDSGKIVKKVELKNKDEINFVHKYYGVKQ